jgi:hypothetical protein
MEAVARWKRWRDENGTQDSARSLARALRRQTTATPPKTTHTIARTRARAQTTATNGRSKTEEAHPVRQRSTEVLCPHWPPTPTALHLRISGEACSHGCGSEWRRGLGRGSGRRTAEPRHRQRQHGEKPRGLEAKEKQLESYFTKKPRGAAYEAAFEHRHHRKAPSALAGG